MSSSSSSCYLLIDLDRVLYNTDALSQLYIDTLSRHFPQHASQLRTQEQAGRGSAFSMLDHLRALLTDKEIDMITRECRDNALQQPDAHYMPGARETLEYLRGGGQQFGIFTYGNKAWQQLKLAIIGADDIPHHITQAANKPAEMMSWYDTATQTFRLPRSLRADGSVQRLIIVDDKPSNVTQLPPHVAGVHIAHAARPAHGALCSAEYISPQLMQAALKKIETYTR